MKIFTYIFCLLVLTINAGNIVYYIPPYDNNINARLNDDNKFLDLTEPSGQYIGVRTAFFQLKELLSKLGYELKLVSPSNKLQDVAFIIDHDGHHPANQDALDWRNKDIRTYSKNKLVLLMGEPPSVAGSNFTINARTGTFEIFRVYHKVFATTDLLTKKDYNNQVTRIYFPQPITKMITPIPFEQKRLLVLAAGDKNIPHPHSGYARRREWVQWCMRYNIKDFDIYGGYNWTTWAKSVPMYKGVVPLSDTYDPSCKIARGLIDKIELIKNYKFYLCYENELVTKGWLTEKIFECFVAGCVPIYWGPSNIGLYIPKNCYIDRREFRSNNELYNFIKKMKLEEYNLYLNNIKLFLESKRMSLFTVPYFLHCIISTLIPNYDKNLVFNAEDISIIETAIAEQRNITKHLRKKKKIDL